MPWDKSIFERVSDNKQLDFVASSKLVRASKTEPDLYTKIVTIRPAYVIVNKSKLHNLEICQSCFCETENNHDAKMELYHEKSKNGDSLKAFHWTDPTKT